MVGYGTGFLVQVFGTDFWYICHGHSALS